MIKQKTTFVLGAGASIPYGFPSGAELRNAICADAINQNSQMSQTLYRECGIGPDILTQFGNTFQHSSLSSIDAFLARRADYEQLGKLSIAFQLGMREEAQHVFRMGNDDHWYEYLWNAMTDGAHSISDMARVSVCFITFNYDRSLEFFLYEAARNTFGVSNEEAYKFLTGISILHVYGSLGAFHFDEVGDARLYLPSTSGRALSRAAKGIRVIPESREDDKEFVAAREWLGWADQICFLGFGFDPLNMSRLAIGTVLSYLRKENDRVPRIVCSGYGKTKMEKLDISNKYFSAGGIKDFEEYRNLQLLRETGVLAS